MQRIPGLALQLTTAVALLLLTSCGSDKVDALDPASEKDLSVDGHFHAHDDDDPHHRHDDMEKQGPDRSDQGSSTSQDIGLGMPPDMLSQADQKMSREADLRIYIECQCDDLQAVCLTTLCSRPDVDCRQRECPQGYLCNSANYCQCDDPSAPRCRPACSTIADCQREEFCDSSGHCVRQVGCNSDAQCPYGLWCYEGYCAEKGDKKTGEACGFDVECESGYCRNNACGIKCTLDRDCPQGQTCSEGGRNVCTGIKTFCSVSCGKDQDCRGTECINERCSWTGDCSQGVCHLLPGLRTGNCQGTTNPCKAREFQTVKDDAYCRIAVVCDLNDPKACEPPYTCEKDGFTGNPYRRNVCSRKLEP